MVSVSSPAVATPPPSCWVCSSVAMPLLVRGPEGTTRFSQLATSERSAREFEGADIGVVPGHAALILRGAPRAGGVARGTAAPDRHRLRRPAVFVERARERVHPGDVRRVGDPRASAGVLDEVHALRIDGTAAVGPRAARRVVVSYQGVGEGDRAGAV